uniref:Der GTPase-activating protein YihI n=1 Tax=Ningiella ruwaisensis TaxID=2364274 RepID=UPI0010A07233|nr:Der GTPase-activating protein YihI [Ningiella ruwaisensis]
MGHSKKSRKIGKIGVSKSDAPKKPRSNEKPKPKKKAGRKPGSRQQEVKQSNKNANEKPKQDPRSGSKKAIDLSRYAVKSATSLKQDKPKPQVAKPKYKTPQLELVAIEEDMRLEALLEKREKQRLSADEQSYVDTLLARHQQLCELLGINADDDEKDVKREDDPFAALDAIKLDDFKD